MSAAGTVRFRFVLFRSRGRSTAGSRLVRSRPAPPLTIRSSRIVVTVIAARRTFTAEFANYETGRPLRLAAPDAVQPLTQPSYRTTAAVKRADVLRVRKSGDAIRHDDFVPRDPKRSSNPRRCMPGVTVDGMTR